MGKEVIFRILFCLESFQMKANGERKFLLFFCLQLIIAGFIRFIWKIRALPNHHILQEASELWLSS